MALSLCPWDGHLKVSLGSGKAAEFRIMPSSLLMAVLKATFKTR